MMVAEFLDWGPVDGRVRQLADGEKVAMAPAGTTHGRIQSETSRLLGNHLAEAASPCAVITAPGIALDSIGFRCTLAGFYRTTHRVL